MTTARVRRLSRAPIVCIVMLMAACAAPPARIASPASTLTPAATLAATLVITATPDVTNEPSPATPAAADDADDVVIFFEVSGGFAGRYESWTIRGDGQVQRNTGETYAVAPERVAQLLNEIEDAGFSDLNALYDEVSCADCFVYYIAITRDGQTKSIEAVDANQLPQSLRDIITSLRGFVASLG